MRKVFHFTIDDRIYERVSETIQETLSKKEKDRKSIIRIILSAEEVLGKMLENRDGQEGDLKMVVARSRGEIRVILFCSGREFELVTDGDVGWDDLGDEMGEMSQGAIREILINSFSENLSYSHKNGENRVVIRGKQHDHFMMYLTAAALVLGIAFGFVMKLLLGDTLSAGLENYCLDPIRTMFVNALSMLVSPVVFFAMVCCISNFASLRDIGKIGVRILCMYLMTTTIAVCLGFALYHTFPVGDPALLEKSGGVLSMVTESEDMEEMEEAVEAAEEGASVIDTIVGIVSDNVVTPFMENNLLQLIFLGIFLGIGIAALRDRHPELRPFFVRFNDLFMTLLGMLCKLIPAAVFCNMASLVYSTGTDALMAIVRYVLLCAGAIVCMMVIYHILILLMARVNPLVFTKHYARVMITALTLSSTTAALPVSMETCRKMGISNKVVSFSLPLGSSINMDGSSLVMSIICLFMAETYGVEITPTLLVTVLVSIILLSLGAPSMAGADLAIVMVRLSQIGIPATAIALIMGVDTLLDMMQAMCNTTSDAAVALIVARRSGELDLEKYR